MKFWANNVRLKLLGLVLALVGLLALAVCFSLLVVQVQAAAAAYLAGQSIWSRAQLGTVYELERYSREGEPEQLQRARQWLAVIQADQRAREGIETDALTNAQITQAFIAGRNHPDDIPSMIWLYRCCNDVGHLRRAAEIWRESDAHVAALEQVANRLERQWQSGNTDMQAQVALRKQLSFLNVQLNRLTEEFRGAMSHAARWMTTFLSLASLLFFLFIALLVWWLGWILMRTLQRTQESFQAIFEQAEVGMIQLDEHGNILDVNPAICKTLNYSREQLTRLNRVDLVYPEDWGLGAERREQMRTGDIDSYTIEQRLVKGVGGVVWARMTVSRITSDMDGERLFAIIEDVSESRRLSVELSYQATHDALTGIHNRRAFERRLSIVLAEARAEQLQHALLLIDLDQFKVVNDTSGHHAGDRLLQQVVDLLRRTLREHDMLARLGGDEFAVILENCGLDVAARVADKLRSELSGMTFVWEQRRYDLTCSIGVIPVSAATPDTEHLLSAADIACYLAKEQGRNRVYISELDDQQHKARQGEMEWLNRIRGAIAESRLFLDAQLIVPTRPGLGGLRYEVLVRLKSEQGEVVPPGVFLPAAERFGAAYAIDRWVIEHTFSQLASHPEHLYQLESCHINLSGVSLDQSDLYDFIVGMLEQYAIPAEKICFEVTETAAVNNLAEAIKFMEQLGQKGCHFGLDDFGTGLSSFSYLRRLPIDDLKIDGVFVRDIDRDETDLAMVRAINEIGQTLHKKTIAEFVENQAIFTLLMEMGVDFVQGFGVHKPCRFSKLLATPDPLTLVQIPPQ
ncbi:putative bifunctional diguanylate cyclase/phosphodiesterase [Gilvimarinus agarilyticus]|uniref:putative bifunctional diguanylate cyclase/phosphodiesterase n=1 Tax=Gilvimarinus agarilyticus TaxID=679259 RepID=UPI000695C422|nr:EAL domain-containing protein [Gilvimarinus agarilyticus]